MITQTDKIIEYIDRFGSITALDALGDLGIMRLAARIGELRVDGLDIKTDMQYVRNRFDERIKIARYSWA